MLITKAQILKAIETEPLAPGNWIHGNSDTCPVCAVGATLRACGVAPHQISDTAIRHSCAGIPDDEADWRDEAMDSLSEGDYLGALSVAFEGLCTLHDLDFVPAGAASNAPGMPEVRRELAEFVQEEYPESFEI